MEKLKSRERALRPEGIEVEREKKILYNNTVVQLIELKSSSQLNCWKKKSFILYFNVLMTLRLES